MSQSSASIAASRLANLSTRGVPLTPTELRLSELPGAHRRPTQPVLPARVATTPAAPPAPRVSNLSLNWKDSLANVGNDLFKPLLPKNSSKIDSVLAYGLALFFVWAGYLGVPGLAETYPISQSAGMIYLAVLVPAALFASCVCLLAGKFLGRRVGLSFLSRKKN